MKEIFVPRICTNCEIHHVENCEECFGFGLYLGQSGNWVPVSASRAHDKKEGTYKICHVCGGSLAGHIKDSL